MKFGVYATDDVDIQAELDALVTAKTSGLTIISKGEYDKMLGKKKPLHSSQTSLGGHQPIWGQAPDPEPVRAVEPVVEVGEDELEEEESPLSKEDLSVVEPASDKPVVEEVEGDTEADKIIGSFRELSDLLGVDEEELKFLAKEPGAPKRQKKGHSLSEWKKYIAEAE